MNRMDCTHISTLENELDALVSKTDSRAFDGCWSTLFRFLTIAIKVQLKTYDLLKDINHMTG